MSMLDGVVGTQDSRKSIVVAKTAWDKVKDNLEGSGFSTNSDERDRICSGKSLEKTKTNKSIQSSKAKPPKDHTVSKRSSESSLFLELTISNMKEILTMFFTTNQDNRFACHDGGPTDNFKIIIREANDLTKLHTYEFDINDYKSLVVKNDIADLVKTEGFKNLITKLKAENKLTLNNIPRAAIMKLFIEAMTTEPQKTYTFLSIKFKKSIDFSLENIEEVFEALKGKIVTFLSLVGKCNPNRAKLAEEQIDGLSAFGKAEKVYNMIIDKLTEFCTNGEKILEIKFHPKNLPSPVRKRLILQA
jgi:hypothetical protein